MRKPAPVGRLFSCRRPTGPGCGSSIVSTVDGMNRSLIALGAAGVLALSALPAVAHAQESAPIPSGACEPADFDAVVPEWPGVAGTTVEWCDGQWAVAGASQTDWKIFFHFDGTNWMALAPDGTKSTGMQQGCFNGIELGNQGAPQEFIDRTPICTPEEIGDFPS